MAEHRMELVWTRDGAVFTDNRYSRRHRWLFDGGAEVTASSSPHVVPVPMSDPAAVDPEEAFLASLSSCHMLWFLSIAAARRFVVERYSDKAVGVLEQDATGRLAMTRVTLRPEVQFAGEAPTNDQLAAMHDEANARCFIASSVRSEVRCEPIMTPSAVMQ